MNRVVFCLRSPLTVLFSCTIRLQRPPMRCLRWQSWLPRALNVWLYSDSSSWRNALIHNFVLKESSAISFKVSSFANCSAYCCFLVVLGKPLLLPPLLRVLFIILTCGTATIVVWWWLCEILSWQILCILHCVLLLAVPSLVWARKLESCRSRANKFGVH